MPPCTLSSCDHSIEDGDEAYVVVGFDQYGPPGADTVKQWFCSFEHARIWHSSRSSGGGIKFGQPQQDTYHIGDIVG